VKVLSIHACNAIEATTTGKGRVQNTSIGIDSGKNDGFGLENSKQYTKIRAIEAVEPLLVIDDVIAWTEQFRYDFSARRAFQVVIGSGAFSSGS